MALQLLKNYLALAGGEIFSKLAVFAAFVYLARILGPANFGHIEWAAAVLMCASLIVDQGLSAYGAREIAKDPGKTARLTSEIVTARFLLAGLSYSILAVFAVWFVADEGVRALVLIFGLSLWALPLQLNWVFQGHDRMKTVALIQMIRFAVFAIVVFAFVRGAEDLLIIGAAETVSVICAGVFCIFAYRRIFPEHIRLRPSFSGELLREGLPIGLSQMFWVVKMFGATLIVGLIATAEETGYFAGAMRIMIALHTFVWLYFANLLPSLARAWQKGRAPFAELSQNSMRLVAALVLVGAIVWVAAAPTVIALAYGREFSSAAGALQWLAGVCAAAAISGHFRFGLIAANFQKREMLTAAVGAAAALIFITLGYFGWGTSGAAAGLFFAEILVLLCAWLFARRTLFGESLAENNRFETLPEATR